MAFCAPARTLGAWDADADRNATFQLGLSYRALASNLGTLVQQLPAPLMFRPKPSDLDFFRSNLDFFRADVDTCMARLWPERLMAEKRLRLMGSSDLAFFVTAKAVESDGEIEAGRLYNDRFYYELPHHQTLEALLVTLRREPFLS